MENKNNSVRPSSSRTVLYIILSGLAALILWVYVAEAQGDDIKITLPGISVVFEGENVLRETREMIVSDIGSNSVTVTFSGSRRVLSGLNDKNISAVIDLSAITRTGNWAQVPTIRYPNRTDTSAITSVVVEPETVSFYVDKLDKKTVEVKGVFNGSAAEGYSADPLVFSPSTVIVYGPAKVLANVKDAFVEVNRTDVDRTLSFGSTYVLRDENGEEFKSDELTFSDETVEVTLPILAVKEVSLTVELIAGGGATKENVKWKLEPATVTLTGDAEALSGVNSIPVARIDLATVDEPITETYRFDIPNDTEIASGSRETTLTLEIGGLSRRSFSIDQSNIACINVSEGFTATVMNTRLDNVVIRGPEDVVKGLNELNIRAVADLSNYGTATGIVSVPVSISINGTTEAGAVGEYRVYINIAEEQEEVVPPTEFTEEE